MPILRRKVASRRSHPESVRGLPHDGLNLMARSSAGSPSGSRCKNSVEQGGTLLAYRIRPRLGSPRCRTLQLRRVPHVKTAGKRPRSLGGGALRAGGESNSRAMLCPNLFFDRLGQIAEMNPDIASGRTPKILEPDTGKFFRKFPS